nr:hypothetical protein B0A51_15802 [Rachicladosporium sp. CCFEE 5018]
MASAAPGNVINCPCLEIDQEDPRKFVQCSICSTWQHLLCMGLPLSESDLPDRYYCHICQPTEHPLLMTCTEAGKVAELVEMRNERATTTARSTPTIKRKTEWVMMERLALARRVPNLGSHWPTQFSGHAAAMTTSGDAERTTMLRNNIRHAVDLVVRYSDLLVLEDLRAALIRRMHQNEVDQVAVLWDLRETISMRIFTMAEVNKEDAVAAANLVILYYDCRQAQGFRDTAPRPRLPW